MKLKVIALVCLALAATPVWSATSKSKSSTTKSSTVKSSTTKPKSTYSSTTSTPTKKKSHSSDWMDDVFEEEVEDGDIEITEECEFERKNGKMYLDCD